MLETLPMLPTSQLPSIRQISSYPLKDIFDAVKYLKLIYNPVVRGSRRHRLIVEGNEASTSLHACHLDDLRSDAFERSYSIRWLTVLISQVESWNAGPAEASSAREIETLIQEAASLLAICSGTAAAGIVVRDFAFTACYSTGSRKLDIHLKDVPLDNRDYGSVGAQTWGGACVLAETIAEDPKRFGLLRSNMHNGLRILELGAGTGLVSLTVGKVIEYAPVGEAPVVEIVATDYYPSVLANLDSNVRSNFSASNSAQAGNSIRISTHRLDWSLFATMSAPPYPFHEPFDLVLGADIVYEVQHAAWIKSCLERLLRKPTPNDSSLGPQFHLVIPLRSTHLVESDTIGRVFPTTEMVVRQEGDKLELGIRSKETFVCDAGDESRTDQIEYAYYVIGWF